MKKLTLLFVFVIFLFFIRTITLASSSYVLPYPSYMPGSTFYKAHLFIEYVSKYLYFGNFSQFEHNRKYSDKYLIEAKTLFEYGQFLLAIKALEKSDFYFSKETYFLTSAAKENKNINNKRKLLAQESDKHIEVLEEIRKRIPEKFTWQPEKSPSAQLNIHIVIDNSIKIRKLLHE